MIDLRSGVTRLRQHFASRRRCAMLWYCSHHKGGATKILTGLSKVSPEDCLEIFDFLMPHQGPQRLSTEAETWNHLNCVLQPGGVVPCRPRSPKGVPITNSNTNRVITTSRVPPADSTTNRQYHQQTALPTDSTTNRQYHQQTAPPTDSSTNGVPPQ